MRSIVSNQLFNIAITSTNKIHIQWHSYSLCNYLKFINIYSSLYDNTTMKLPLWTYVTSVLSLWKWWQTLIMACMLRSVAKKLLLKRNITDSSSTKLDKYGIVASNLINCRASMSIISWLSKILWCSCQNSSTSGIN